MRNIILSIAAALALAAPAGAKSAAQAQVQCTDGTTAKSGRGACSHHGGVAKGAAAQTGSAKAVPSEPSAAAPAPRSDQQAGTEAKEPQGNAKTQNNGGVLGGLFGRRPANDTPRSSTRDAKSGSPTARCKDGTMSYSAHHSGTCSGHGGVQDWLDK